MDLDIDKLTKDTLERFLKEQERRLDVDKKTLKKKDESLEYRHSVSGHEGKLQSSAQQESSPSPLNHKAKNKRMINDKSTGYVLLNRREQEKDRLINSLSVPKTRHSYPNIKVKSKVDSAIKLNSANSAVDAREKEKDRLAAIFASSGEKFAKTSTCRVQQNLKNEKFIEKTQNSDSNKTNVKCSNTDHKLKNNNQSQPPTVISDKLDSTSDNSCVVPRILVSQYPEDLVQSHSATDDNTMVRIGEFSPLNPNNPAGRPILGIGEYDERRKLFQGQRRQEYCQYFQQNQQQPDSQSPSHDRSCHNLRLRNMATQTEWGYEAVPYCREQEQTTPRPETSYHEPEQRCRSSSFSLSPLSQGFEGFSEKEIKEHLYREELRKQIEEKNRIKEEMKKREAEEEARLEAKIQRDWEKINQQYEAERVQRLELAIRKKEQEDILRQRLAAEQQKVQQEAKTKRKQALKDKSTSPRDMPTKSRQSDHRIVPSSQLMPANCASKTLSEVHKVLKQPLLEIKQPSDAEISNSTSPNVSLRNVSALHQPQDMNRRSVATTSPPIQQAKEVDMLVQRAVFDPRMEKSDSRQSSYEQPPYLSHNVTDKIDEVNRMLREPLLPETFRVLPPMSPPSLHVAIPPVIPSSQPAINPPQSPPVPGSKRLQRTNCEILEDKWKVPYVERYNAAAPPDVTTKHSRSVLTQLGTFRRQLQQERLRMQQRLQAESP